MNFAPQRNFTPGRDDNGMAAKRSTATAVEPVLIHPDALYTSQQVQRLLGVCKSTLREARQSQGLVASRRAGRDWYFGADLLAWLRAGRCSRGGADAVEEAPLSKIGEGRIPAKEG
jgi:hypothetical protein